MERVAIKGPFVQNRLTHFKSMFCFYTPMSPKNVRNRIFAWNGLKKMAMQKKKKKKNPLKISSVTVTKFAGNCGAMNKSNKW